MPKIDSNYYRECQKLIRVSIHSSPGCSLPTFSFHSGVPPWVQGYNVTRINYQHGFPRIYTLNLKCGCYLFQERPSWFQRLRRSLSSNTTRQKYLQSRKESAEKKPFQKAMSTEATAEVRPYVSVCYIISMQKLAI